MILHPKLDVPNTDDCIEWDGAMHKQGYGILSLNRKTATKHGLARVQFVHRMSHYYHNGPIEGLVVRHTCDNKRCFNPKHLITGTHADNYQDAVERGISKRILTHEEAAEIRTSSESNRKLAEKYGVSSTTVFHIKHGNKWRNDGKSPIQEAWFH